ncbi:HD domain-containing phosphohydrolase [uncultured Cellulomonas sp.]|uniref:HD-GYP domain-containing protein n=1 Tax=uncultured Cellulomonas sp. TaxID=189682 RepID=UPI0028EB6A44|nr:HD domain-containing phosphohydrolase [uncultured Cellulomonas sp.]
MAFGPTQNYDDASLGVWKGHPVLAAAIRMLISSVPVVLSVGLGLVAVHWFPPRRLGVNPWIWLLVELCCATAVLLLATRLARRFLPLATLLRLTLYFPDRAPSRLAVAMSHYSPNALQARLVASRRPRGLRPDDEHAARILRLVAAISDHDRLTRGHSERVQAYSALIGRELGLSGPEAAKLSWAALLHDVGKLRVPATLLSKPGEPTTSEWAVLAGHPEAGMEIAQPLAEWLGPWLDVIGQHHERWDGDGYPSGLAGTAISRGARIVAVADAYDVITTARSYKRALPAAAARAELARCAGEQFDPQVVRAFLAIGLGRLRRVAGPLSILSVLPGVPTFAADLPSVVQRFTTVGALKSTGAIGLVLSVSTATAGGTLADALRPSEPVASIPAGTSAVAPVADESVATDLPTSIAVADEPPATPTDPEATELVPEVVVAEPPVLSPLDQVAEGVEGTSPTDDSEGRAAKRQNVEKAKKTEQELERAEQAEGS